jgi:hypothetical protein
MYRGSRNFFGGIAGGLFLIFLALAFMTGHFFLPMIFVGLAFASLFGSLSAGNPRATYGGVMGFIWMMGLAACAAFNFWWPGILIIVGISTIAGTLFRPMMNSQVKTDAPQQPVYYQPSQPSQQAQQPSEQPYYQPYQEGYKPPQEGYQEGGKVHPYPEQPHVQEYEQPQAQYPQELPPQQQ